MTSLEEDLADKERKVSHLQEQNSKVAFFFFSEVHAVPLSLPRAN
jgi:hypothetical protein